MDEGLPALKWPEAVDGGLGWNGSSGLRNLRLKSLRRMEAAYDRAVLLGPSPPTPYRSCERERVYVVASTA